MDNQNKNICEHVRDILVIEHNKQTPIEEQEDNIRKAVEEYLSEKRKVMSQSNKNNEQENQK